MLANWLSESTSSTTTAAASTTGGGPAENVLPFVRGGGGGGGGGLGGGRRRGSTASGGGEGDRDSAAAAAAAAGSFDPDPSSVVEAHGHATQAEEYRREGHLLEALHEHLEASRCFLEAAEALPDVNSVTGAALILLSDGHARQAKTLQQILRKSDAAAAGGSSSPSTITTPLFKAGGGRVVPPAVPKPGGLGGDAGGSMYSSAMIGSTASVTTAGQQERAWASQVDDMLALERALQAIGSQPLFSSGTFQATERGGAGGGGGGVGGGAGGGGNAAGRYLSSTLGDSFFLVNTRNAANREGVVGGGLTNASIVWEGGSMMSSKAGKGPSTAGAAATAQGLRAPLRVGVGSPRGNSPLTMPPQASSTGATGTSHHHPSSSTTTSTIPLSSSPRNGGNNLHTNTHTTTSTTSGGFLDGIESVQQGEVMRLLGCMKTLGDENAILIKQVEEGTRVKQENERLRREVNEFKDLYNAKFKQLRAALEEFRTKYPHEANPTNHVSSSVDKARIKNLEAEVEQLFARLNREKEAGRKKDAMIRRYEQWYKTLKASALSKGRSGGGGGGNNGGGTGGQQQPQQQQQQQQQRMPSSSSSSSSSGRGVGGASGGSNSNRPPPGR